MAQMEKLVKMAQLRLKFPKPKPPSQIIILCHNLTTSW